MQWSEYTTAERLKALRAGMTQEQLAEAAAVSVGVVRKLERGGTASPLLPIASALGTDIAVLLVQQAPRRSMDRDERAALRIVSAATHDAAIGIPADTEPGTIEELRAVVQRADAAYWAGRYTELGALLGALLPESRARYDARLGTEHARGQHAQPYGPLYAATQASCSESLGVEGRSPGTGLWAGHDRVMEKNRLAQDPAAYACMIVRKPAEEAFRAFADPAVTSRFWYSKSSGPMVAGAELCWEWETYGASVDVRVQEVQEGRLIRFEWGNYEQPTTVELRFTPHAVGATYVEVSEAGFQGTAEEAVRWVNDTVGGFTTALCAMKALLEHGIELNAVPDHHPA